MTEAHPEHSSVVLSMLDIRWTTLQGPVPLRLRQRTGSLTAGQRYSKCTRSEGLIKEGRVSVHTYKQIIHWLLDNQT